MRNARPPEGYSYGSSDYPYSLRGRKPGEMPFVPPEEIPDDLDPEKIMILKEEFRNQQKEKPKRPIQFEEGGSKEIKLKISEGVGQGSVRRIGMRKSVGKELGVTRMTDKKRGKAQRGKK